MPELAKLSIQVPDTKRMPPRVLGTVPETGQGPKSQARIFMRIKSNIERSPTRSKPRVVTAAKRERRAVQRQHDPSIRPQKKAKLNSHGSAIAAYVTGIAGILAVGIGIAALVSEKFVAGMAGLVVGCAALATSVILYQAEKANNMERMLGRRPGEYPVSPSLKQGENGGQKTS